MQIIINSQKVKIGEKMRAKIQSKITRGIEKYLTHYQEDLKVASLSVERFLRSGYQIKFDMNLPGAPVNITENSRLLMDGILKVRDTAKRQLRKQLDKLRSY
jgi:ribosomal subunit interface protein